MKRTSYIKRNSSTQKACTKAANTVSEILEMLHLTREAWLNILFDTGCRFVESKGYNARVTTNILTDVNYGFWALWITVFVEHDAFLLNERCIEGYKRHKYNLIKNVQIDLL